MQIDIHKKEDDLEALTAFCHDMIERSYYPAYRRDVMGKFLEYHSREQIEADARDGRVWVARDAGQIVGTVTAANGELSRMFVDPAMRGRGLGRELACAAIGYARETGVSKFIAWSVPFSRGFYEKLGFTMLNADTLDFNYSRELPVPYIEMALWPQGAPQISILAADAADAEEILAGQREAFAEQCRIYDHWDIPPMTEKPEDYAAFLASGGAALKAVHAGRIIGGVRGKVVNGAGEIGRLWVSPNWQGRHAACMLMSALEERLQGCGAFSLYTGERSDKNLKFYARQGYAPTGRRSAAKAPGSAGAYDLVWLEKPNSWPEIEACARRFRPI